MSNKKKVILPSLIASNLCQIETEIRNITKAGADMIHIDVMDQHYVPNLTLGPLFSESIKKNLPQIKQDVHLMVKPVDDLITAYGQCKVDQITIHPESSNHVDRSIKLIKSFGCKAGIALNPSTPLSVLDYLLDEIDIILIMSVNPGFSGQSFIKNSIQKANALKEKVKNHPLIDLYIDGGVNKDNIQDIAFLDGFILGNGLFKAKDYESEIKILRQKLNA